MAFISAIGAAVTGFFASLTWSSVGSFLLRSVASMGLSALAQKLSGKGAKSQGFGVKGQLERGADVPQAFIMGRYATAGSLTYANTTGHENLWMTWVITLSDLPCAGVTGLWVNGSKVTPVAGREGWTFVEEYIANDGSHIEDPRIQYRVYDGTQSVADDWLANEVSSAERPWEVSAIGTGKAYVVVRAAIDPERFRNGFPNFLFEVDGIPLYNPAKDSSVGGAGTHRWSDPSTWEVSENPAVQLYNVLRGIRFNDQWFYGLQDVSAAQLPVAHWIRQINKCAASIDGADGSEPLFRSSAEIPVDAEIHEIIENLLTACNGRLSDAGGVYKLFAGAPDTPVMALTDDDIISTAEQTFTPFLGLADTVNGVAAKYPSPAAGWQVETAPPLYRPDFEVQDGGRRLLVNVSLDFVPYAEQAQRLMQAALNEARRARRHTFHLPPKFWPLEPGDVVSWTSERNGYIAKLFRVDGVIDLPDADVIVDLTEVDPADYDFDTAIDFTPPAVPSTLPQPIPVQEVQGFVVAPASLNDATGAGRRPAIHAMWNNNLNDVQSIIFELRVKATGETLDQARSDTVHDGQVYISTGILPAITYEVRAKFIPASPRPTEWTVWKEVTAPDIRPGFDDLAEDVATRVANAQAAAAEVRADHNALVEGFTRGNLANLQVDYDATAEAAANAQTARDQAQTARDTSLAYRDAAQAARGAAETARDEAQSAATNADGSATAAAGSASTAATRATDAGNSATAASAAQVSAESARDAAQGHATASSSSASSAATKATEAAQSAAAAQSARTGAETARGGAEIARDAAVTSETNAAGSASSAASSAELSAYSRYMAQNAAAQNMIADAKMIVPDAWRSHYGRDPSVYFNQDIDGGKGYVNIGDLSNWWYQKQPHKIVADRTYQFRIQYRASPDAGRFYFTWALENTNDYGAINFIPVQDGEWHEHVTAGTGSTILNQVAGDMIQFGFAANHSNGAAGSFGEVRFLEVRDITERVEAENSANAAASSASTAASEASDAGQSASSATAARNAAQTARGQAESARDAAATSETNAAGSANAASTSASNAAQSESDALGHANAASTSASTAATKASEASTSATAANSAKTAAETAKGQAETSATNAATSETNAAGSANSASSSASVAASAKNTTVMVEGNPDFSAGYEGWMSGYYYPSPDLNSGSGDIGTFEGRQNVFASTPGVVRYIAQKKVWTIHPGRKYRLRGSMRVTGAGSTRMYMGMSAVDDGGYATGSNAGLMYLLSGGGMLTEADGWQDLESIVFDLDYIQGQKGADAVGVRLITFPNYNGVAGMRGLIDGIWLEDVTDSYEAGQSASAAATSASEASASETAAGQSASAAQTARTGAETARSEAQTAETNAVSAKNSAESASATAVSAKNVAVSVRDELTLFADQQFEGNWERGGQYWVASYAHSEAALPSFSSLVDAYSDASLVTAAGEGKVLRLEGVADRVTTERGLRPFIEGQKIRLRVRMRKLTGAPGIRVWMAGTDHTGAYANYREAHGSSVTPATSSWETYEFEFDPYELRLSGNSVFANAAHWRLMLGFGYTSTNGQLEIASIQLDDVTESASVQTLQTAVADLEGNASAGYLIKAQAGNQVSLIDLIAADGSTGAVSVAKVSAQDILLDGSVTASKLLVAGNNLLQNGNLQSGDLSGWKPWSNPDKVFFYQVSDRRCIRINRGAYGVSVFSGSAAYSNNGALQESMPLKAGAKYRFEVTMWSNVAAPTSFMMFFHKADGSYNNSFTIGSVGTTTTWGVYAFEFTVPSYVIGAHLYIYGPSSAIGVQYFAAMSIKEMDGADLIVSGGIKGDKIQIDDVTLDTDGNGNLIIKNDGVGRVKIIDGAVSNGSSLMQWAGGATAPSDTYSTAISTGPTDPDEIWTLAWAGEIRQGSNSTGGQTNVRYQYRTKRSGVWGNWVETQDTAGSEGTAWKQYFHSLSIIGDFDDIQMRHKFWIHNNGAADTNGVRGVASAVKAVMR